MVLNTKRLAITTLVVGRNYPATWAQQMLPTWAHYCERHDFDLIAFLSPLDGSDWAKGRKFNWQKCLILEQPELASYDQVAWLDADIAINARHAPSVFEGCPPEKIGGVGIDALPTAAPIYISPAQMTVGHLETTLNKRDMLTVMLSYPGQHRTEATAKAEIEGMYRTKGVSFEVRDLINTGVMVLSPLHHAALLREIYTTYKDIYAPLSDQFAIPAEAYRRDILHNLDSRFNVQVNGEISTRYPFLIFSGREYREMTFLCLQSAFLGSYFLHFAAAQQRQEFFSPIVYDWKDFIRVGASPFPSISMRQLNSDPNSLFASYFSCMARLLDTKPYQPALQQDRLLFRPARMQKVHDEAIKLPENRDGFYARENAEIIGRTYQWVDGRTATTTFEVGEEIGAEKLIKVRAHHRFLQRRAAARRGADPGGHAHGERLSVHRPRGHGHHAAVAAPAHHDCPVHRLLLGAPGPEPSAGGGAELDGLLSGGRCGPARDERRHLRHFDRAASRHELTARGRGLATLAARLPESGECGTICGSVANSVEERSVGLLRALVRRRAGTEPASGTVYEATATGLRPRRAGARTSNATGSTCATSSSGWPRQVRTPFWNSTSLQSRAISSACRR